MCWRRQPCQLSISAASARAPLLCLTTNLDHSTVRLSSTRHHGTRNVWLTLGHAAVMAPRLDRGKWLPKTSAKSVYCLTDRDVRRRVLRVVAASGLWDCIPLPRQRRCGRCGIVPVAWPETIVYIHVKAINYHFTITFSRAAGWAGVRRAAQPTQPLRPAHEAVPEGKACTSGCMNHTNCESGSCVYCSWKLPL